MAASLNRNRNEAFPARAGGASLFLSWPWAWRGFSRVLAAGLMLMNVHEMGGEGQEPRKPLLIHNLLGTAEAGGGYREALGRLEGRFLVRSIEGELKGDLLKAARLVLLLPEGQPLGGKDEASARETARALDEYVEQGGGLILLAGGESVGDRGGWHRRLLLKWGFAQSGRRTGAKNLTIAQSHPILGGLTWASEGWRLLDMEEASALAAPKMVFNDLGQLPRRAGSADYAGIAMAMGGVGMGKVVITADAGWVLDSGPGEEKGARAKDNLEILERIAAWAAFSSRRGD